MSRVGIDLGSRAVKIVIFDNFRLQKSLIFDTAKFYMEFGKSKDGKFYIDCEKLGFKPDDEIIATGYGRNNLSIGNAKIINEIKAHILGAIFQTQKKDFLLLDIGGQDVKVVNVVDQRISQLKLNDKCAASCGRYLENMANIIGVNIEEMSNYSKNPVELSSTCAVFGESELIGRISEGYSVQELSAGVNYSLYQRIIPLIEPFSQEVLVLTGGVALNHAIQEYLRLSGIFKEIIVPSYSQLNGAIGCAVS